jgi:hypothetical protein
MKCYVCRSELRSQIMCTLDAPEGEHGWALICISCAIEYRLPGRLLAEKDDPDVTRWLHFQEEWDLPS